MQHVHSYNYQNTEYKHLAMPNKIMLLLAKSNKVMCLLSFHEHTAPINSAPRSS